MKPGLFTFICGMMVLGFLMILAVIVAAITGCL